jgi:hypothetical protein
MQEILKNPMHTYPYTEQCHISRRILPEYRYSLHDLAPAVERYNKVLDPHLFAEGELAIRT